MEEKPIIVPYWTHVEFRQMIWHHSLTFSFNKWGRIKYQPMFPRPVQREEITNSRLSPANTSPIPVLVVSILLYISCSNPLQNYNGLPLRTCRSPWFNSNGPFCLGIASVTSNHLTALSCSCHRQRPKLRRRLKRRMTCLGSACVVQWSVGVMCAITRSALTAR